jgi:hypothetical protein
MPNHTPTAVLATTPHDPVTPPQRDPGV